MEQTYTMGKQLTDEELARLRRELSPLLKLASDYQPSDSLKDRIMAAIEVTPQDKKE